jgi:hypothetical protein
MLPIHESEEVDNYTGYPLTDENGNSAVWKLKEEDVIILLGMSPPECRYFGFTNYLYSRYSSPSFLPDPSLGPVNGRACLPGTQNERCEYFASVADAINPNRGLNFPGSKYNTSFAIVLSPSRTATDLAIVALQESGVPLLRISNYSFPGSTLSLGDSNTSDSFTTLMRTAFYSNSAESEAFFNEIPFKVLRMEMSGAILNELNPTSVYVPRETGVLNDGTLAGLSVDEMHDAIVSLARMTVQSVIKDYPTTTVDDWDVTQSAFESGEQDKGDTCIDLGQHCLADCRDTLYPFTVSLYNRQNGCLKVEEACSNFGNDTTPCLVLAATNNDILCRGTQRGILTESTDDMMIAIGVNHKAANMSAYSSLAIYDLENLWGVESVGDAALNGTAYRYVDAKSIDLVLVKALPFLYVYVVKRHCDESEEGISCISVPFQARSKEIFVPLSHAIGFAERMYDNPISNVGPSSTEIAMPIQIHMKLNSAT